jgi:hypothetical protein
VRRSLRDHIFRARFFLHHTRTHNFFGRFTSCQSPFKSPTTQKPRYLRSERGKNSAWGQETASGEKSEETCARDSLVCLKGEGNNVIADESTTTRLDHRDSSTCAQKVPKQATLYARKQSTRDDIWSEWDGNSLRQNKFSTKSRWKTRERKQNLFGFRHRHRRLNLVLS